MIPLSVHSYFSLMWGTRSPQKICAVARQLGYRRLALTDTDNLYGLWPLLDGCRQNGISPIVGAEITDPASDARAVCLVENETGYRNLCRLITRRRFAQEKPFDFKAAVADFAAGLLVLTQDTEALRFWKETDVAVAAAVPRRPHGAALGLRKAARYLGLPLAAFLCGLARFYSLFQARLRPVDQVFRCVKRLVPENFVGRPAAG